MFLESNRQYSLVDRLISHGDHILRTICGKPLVTERANPAANVEDTELTPVEKRHVTGLMRVNHAGEVAAQGLYQGQAITARDSIIRDTMQRSAQEENDHLAWCQTRIEELAGHTSYLNPAWYIGSLLMGMAAGLAGDKWSLGFVEETEHQVTKHLHEHEQQLPPHDQKTAKIVAQMKLDEATHADKANHAGAETLPSVVKKLMSLTAKVMTSTAYYV